ncbi:MAG: hypothetical protein V1779_13595 [bacterium]
MNNLNKTPMQVFVDYKSRSQMERMIDALKILQIPIKDMQNEQSLEAWMLINHITLHWYYKILQLLKLKELSNRYTPLNLIRFFKGS